MKRLSVVLTLLLLLQTMFSGLLPFAQADASANENNAVENNSVEENNEEWEENSDSANEEELVENSNSTNEEEEELEETGESSVKPVHHDGHEGFSMEIIELVNNEGEPYTEDNPLGPNDEFILSIDWELENGHNYKGGDYETFELPPEVQMTNEIIGEELRDELGNLVATYDVDMNGLVTIIFEDYVEEHSEVKGWIEIRAKLDQDEAEEEDGNVVISPIEDGGNLEVPLDTSDIERTLEKQGQPNKDYNADEIEWTVTLNKNAVSLSGVTFEDILPGGTEYIDGSMEVEKYSASINGTPIGNSSPVDVTPVYEDGVLSANLGDISDVYIITYRTKVTDMDENTFKNDVTAHFDDEGTLKTDATVRIDRGEPLKKGAVKDYDPKTGIIEWYIEFNYDQQDLTDITLADNWKPEGKVEIVEGSVKFQEVEIDENGNATPVGEAMDADEIGDFEKTADGFEVSGITTDKPYYVVYETKVIERELDGFRIENIASFEDHTYGEGYNIGQYVGAKSAGNINYADKTIEWTIRVNMDEPLMEDVIITDTLGDGLTLIEDSIDINVGGEVLTGFDVEDGNPFKITNIGEIKEEMIITYKTSYDPNQLPEDYKAYNKANIDWIPEGSDDRVNRDVEANTKVNPETIDSSWKSGSYNPDTKEIEWDIIVNYRENSYEDFTIIDTPQGNQVLLEDTIEVYELTINSDGSITKGNQVSVTPNITDGTITIPLGETNKAYGVEYKTSVAGISDLAKTYENKAEIKDGNETIADLDASVDVYGDRKYGAKSGAQDGKQVHWSIDVNPGQELISNLTLTDTISDNQEYLEDTIKVYEASVVNGKNGFEVNKGEELNPSEYELTIEGTEFVVRWQEDVERSFVVEYSTLFFAGHNEDVSNIYEITGDGIEEVEGDSKDSDSVTIRQTGSGGAEGKAGYLMLQKLDTTYGQEESPIKGIEFELIDPETGAVLKEGRTNSEGYIDFGRLLFGDYLLKEVNVPDGYVAPYESEIITIEDEFIPDEDNPMEYILEVENYLPNYNIEVLKVDDEENVLEGAEFTLYEEDGTAVETKSTDEDGMITFESLEAGNYYVQETKAPEGYELDTTKYDVEIVDEQKEAIQLVVENSRVKTSIDVKKEWIGSQEDSVTIYLLADGVEVESIILEDENDWKHTFENLDVYNYDSELREIEYTVEEVEIEGYNSIIEGNKDEGFTVTNVRSGETEVSVVKEWLGEATDSVTIHLLANGEVVDSIELTVEDDWTHTFTELDEFDQAGEPIEYTVEEEALEGYESEVTGSQEDGYTVTNLRVGETEVSVEKEWLGEAAESVTIYLLANGDEIDSVELTDEIDWSHVFTGLSEFDEVGEPIEYTVEEEALEGYEPEVTGSQEDGYTVTNLRIGETEVSVEKEWLGEPADAVRINLLANGEEVDFIELTAEVDWSYVFTGLSEFDEVGEPIEYTVEEEGLEGYEPEVTGSQKDGYTVTNLRVGETEVSVEKEWLGESAESVRINLLANGEEVDSVDLTEEMDWTYVFAGLAEFDEVGEPIEYTVEEVDIEGYESEITGSQEEGFTVTNLRVGFTDITIDKHWLDEGETDRPDSITVNLLQNGVVIGEYEISAGNDWTLTISDLDQFDEEGQEYVYTITEHDVPGYESKVEEYEITNTRVGEKSITITKAWLDDESSDRPGEIEVELYRSVEDGELELVDTYTVSADEDWELTIDSLPSFNDEGKAYTYEIVEVDVEGYESTINGFDLVNLRVGETEVAVEKVWLGSEEDHVTIDLLANGVVVDTVDLSADNNWSYVFENLPKFDEEGAAIEYTVDEVEVDGYTTEITGDAEEGFTVTNTRTGVIELVIEKLWEKDEADSRPDSIVVDVFQNGDLMTTIEISEANDWIVTLNLPKYDENGEEYVYTVEEHSVEGYDTEVTETEEGFTITNTFIPEEEAPEGPENPEDPDNGDELPKTATNMYNYLLIGAMITFLGLIVTVYARRREA